MKTRYAVRGISLAPTDAPNGALVTVYSEPDAREKEEIVSTLPVSPHDLESALDPDEVSRVEFGPDGAFVVWKRPVHAASGADGFEVASVGLLLRPHALYIISSSAEDIELRGREFHGASSGIDVCLAFLKSSIHQFLGHLKAIRQVTQDLEAKISKSMENRYLLKMFGLGESLTFYLNAIEANGTVLVKLKANAARIGLTPEQMETVDDLILDNQQCARQAQIYTTILAGLMDARGTLVNNNMNVLLKKLTVINVIFLPLNLIASIGGMSEFTMMTGGMDWRVSYGLFAIAMLLVAWLTWLILARTVERSAADG